MINYTDRLLTADYEGKEITIGEERVDGGWNVLAVLDNLNGQLPQAAFIALVNTVLVTYHAQANVPKVTDIHWWGTSVAPSYVDSF